MLFDQFTCFFDQATAEEDICSLSRIYPGWSLAQKISDGKISSLEVTEDCHQEMKRNQHQS